MKNSEIKRVLLDKEVNYLYHVNSVLTAITFLENGGLLSRGDVEGKNLKQTTQETDTKDKDLGVYFDIFFDSVDIHKRANKINDYGPVVFVYSIDILDSIPEGSIKITRDNPIRWSKDMKESDRYFVKLDELKLNYMKGTFSQHVTLRNIHDPLSFDFLEKIIIDDPGINNTVYFDDAVKALNESMLNNNIEAHLEIRKCSINCTCKAKYRSCREGYVYYRFKTH